MLTAAAAHAEAREESAEEIPGRSPGKGCRMVRADRTLKLPSGCCSSTEAFRHYLDGSRRFEGSTRRLGPCYRREN